VSISTPVIAEAWRDRDLPKIDRMYQKTALNLLITGLAIFGLVQLNMDNAVRFLGPEYQALGMIVMISGIAKLVDLATGLNTQILLLSKYWKFEFLSNMLLVALSIPLNYWLTKKFNVMGPAYGNLVALAVFNLGRFLLIWKLFGLQPFGPAQLKAVGIALACFLLAFALPFAGNLYLDILLRSTVFVGGFTFLITRLKISEDINGLWDSIKSRFNW
jgi:O-antigen/teichoic acid export membrane protein